MVAGGIWCSHSGRADAVANGAFVGIEGGSGAVPRCFDGRMVCSDRFGKQADSDRGVLDGVEAFDFLASAERRSDGDGSCAAHTSAAFEESDAGRLNVYNRRS